MPQFWECQLYTLAARQQGERGQRDRDTVAAEACKDPKNVLRTWQVSDFLPTPLSLEDAGWNSERDFSEIFP